MLRYHGQVIMISFFVASYVAMVRNRTSTPPSKITQTGGIQRHPDVS